MNNFKLLCIFLGILQTDSVFYTAWTVWLWLDNSTDVDPNLVWGDSGSGFNDANPMNVSDLLTAGATAYRSENIDSWTTHVPDLIRVTYRSANGLPLFSVIFNGTGKTSSDWFVRQGIIVSHHQQMDCVQTNDFTSFSTSFTFYDNTTLSWKYYASAVKTDNSTLYVVVNGDQPLYLPATAVAAFDCNFFSPPDYNPLFDTVQMTKLTRVRCSSYCRERNRPFAALHNVSCSCLSAKPPGSGIDVCNHSCEGDPSEMCGGFLYPPPAIIFNYLNTDIDADHFGTDTNPTENFIVDGVTEKSFSQAYYVYGFRLQVDATYTPVTVNLVITFRAEPCSSNFLTTNETTTETIAIPDDTAETFMIEPIHLQCAYFRVHDQTNDPVTFSVNITLITLKSGEFLTAKFFSIEASWAIEAAENTTTSPNTTTTECECECWIYNMLYGTSEWTNLTYEEKEEALQKVTDQIQRNLTVNKSELSSTKRAKISAEDSRPSAVVVGYTLGAALLTLSLGLIIISDIPKVISSIHILVYNVKSRFGRSNPVQPDIDDFENS